MSFILCTTFTPPLSIPSTSPCIDKEGLLAKVENTRFDRGGLYGSGVVGLKPFFNGKIPSSFKALYTPQELDELQQLQSTDRDVEARMTVKITNHYLNLALQSESLMNLVKARPQETLDLSGSVDPSNQNKYSPVPGLLHKYEMVVLFVARTCSSHCRYCYRFDLFTNKSGKSIIRSEDAAQYIKEFNSLPMSMRKYPHFQITEALLSGGDPMILPNTTLAEYIVNLAEAGVRTIRIGTKELAFFPYRFDANFFAMLDMMHAAFPHVRLVFSVHFTHPAEFLKMEDGEYQTIDGNEDSTHAHLHRHQMNGGLVSESNIRYGIAHEHPSEAIAVDHVGIGDDRHTDEYNGRWRRNIGRNEDQCFESDAKVAGNYKWLDATEKAIMEFNKRGHYISLRNQTPIIKKVNDSTEDLAILQREMFRKGIGNHSIFQCRDIQGKEEFAVLVEESWRLFAESQRGLSGMERQARFVMSTEKGKVEVVGMFDGQLVLRLHRSSFDTQNKNIVICRSNPDALWIEDYVVFDPHGIVF